MDVVVKALVLVAIIALGFGIKRAGWVSASAFVPFSVVVLRITLPSAIAVSFDSFEMVPSLAILPVLAIGVNLALQGAGYVMGGRTGSRAFGVLNVQSFNIALFAIPYVAAFIGPQAIIYVAMFDIGNSIAAAGFGYAWGMSLSRHGQRIGLRSFVTTMLTSPVLVAYVVLAGLRVAGLHLPEPVLMFARTAGSANTFMALLMIGIGLELVLPRHKYATAVRLLATRYVVVFVFACLVWFMPWLGAEAKVIVCMLAFAPMAAMVSGFTSEAGLDVDTSAFMTSVTVLVAIVALPGVLNLLGAG